MASSQFSLFSLSLFFLISLTSSQTPIPPNALVLPISKHASTHQYLTLISQRTPLVPINLVIDLSGPFLWVSCNSSYNSSSYRSAQCHSPLCSLVHGNKPCKHCISSNTPKCSNNDKCIVYSKNVFTSKVSAGYLSEDVLSLQSTDGLNPNSMVSVPKFHFLCAPELLSEGLASGAKGIAGLGLGRLGLPAQLMAEFNISRKFAMCLSPTTGSYGVMFIGDGPYVLFPGIDVSKLLIYTPLIVKAKNTDTITYSSEYSDPYSSYEYYIRIKSLRVNAKLVPLNSSLLVIENKGVGGTKISTVNPYTVMESSIYTSLTKIFIEEAIASNVTRVAPIAPFDVCFSTKDSSGGLARPALPVIDLILQNSEVFWRIFETNSMVPMGKDVACLGFLDGGLNPSASIVLGGYQLEDNLLQFDLVSSRLGFTSSLFLRETSCDGFNFTSNV
ncbi:probable aspartic proteinase GIP2 [Cornus florida]|uniref:probable aspartic proteinase GIP2 n=1 Tax=Cornus florida TaxID=4283 RepID=UPI0028A1737A|nr:probable aspartic proteinase GIP2 [Cornus florida]